MFDVMVRKEGGKLIISAESKLPQPLCLAGGAAGCTVTTAATHRLELDLPPFEVEAPHRLPMPGAQTAFAKILAQTDAGFEMEGLAGSTTEVDVRFVRPPAQISGATLNGGKLTVRFPEGDGYQRTVVRFKW
jgi:hypothetical protein